MQDLIKKVKEKREFSELPDSIVKRALVKCHEDIKETRSFLRKYFGVFLTNKVLKSRGNHDEMLKSHISSKKRNYEIFYSEIFSKGEHSPSIIDLGCGVNGFSYTYLRKVLGEINYVGIEASGQIVKNMNSYFKDSGFESAQAINMDLFEIDKIKKILNSLEKLKPRIVFMFQLIDALESLKKDFSKEFIIEISENCEKIILSFPLVSISGKNKFAVKRKWLIDFLEENFKIEKDFELFGERILVIKTRQKLRRCPELS